MYRPLPPISYLRQRLRLDRKTGHLFWRKQPNAEGSWNVRFAGTRAGAKKHGNYRMIRIDGVAYQEHRIVFALANGRDPGAFQIDHTRPGDGKPRHLRQATNTQNSQHRVRMNSNNKSGVRGVYWNKQCQKWMAEIKVPDRRIYLGVFTELDAAAKVRRAAELEHFGAFAP